MRAFGFKAGIGKLSEVVSAKGFSEQYYVGVLVLSHTGRLGELRIDGRRFPHQKAIEGGTPSEREDWIIMIVATDAPLDSRQLTRIAKRASFGLARAGGTALQTIGDIALAFSTRRDGSKIDEPLLNHFFPSVIDATEEAILNSILKAEALVGVGGRVCKAIAIEEMLKVIPEVSSATGSGGEIWS